MAIRCSAKNQWENVNTKLVAQSELLTDNMARVMYGDKDWKLPQIRCKHCNCEKMEEEMAATERWLNKCLLNITAGYYCGILVHTYSKGQTTKYI